MREERRQRVVDKIDKATRAIEALKPAREAETAAEKQAREEQGLLIHRFVVGEYAARLPSTGPCLLAPPAPHKTLEIHAAAYSRRLPLSPAAFRFVQPV